MWYIKLGGRIRGPFSEDELQRMLKRGEFSTFHQVSIDRKSWKSSEDFLNQVGWESKLSADSTSKFSRKEKESLWYYAENGEKRGPFSIDDLHLLFSRRVIDGDSLVFGPKFSDWIELRNVKQLAQVFNTKLSSKVWVSVSILAVISVLCLSVIFYTSALSGGKEIAADATEFALGSAKKQLSPNADEALLIQSATDMDMIKKAVGNLYLFIVDSNGSNKRYHPVSSGTAFAISPDGYFITNRHVVDKCGLNKSYTYNPDAKPEDRITIDGDIIPFIFLDGIQWDVDILHQSKQFDLAIVKVNRSSKGAFFRLSASEPRLELYEELYASGFPGVSNIVLISEERILKEIAVVEGVTSPNSAVFPREKILTPSKGYFQRMRPPDNGVKLIEHRADFFHGNSGGPLMMENGCVIGINTFGTDEAGKANFSPEISQMREIIDNHVAGVVWEKQQER
jgi:S1-C subfamily serine protease